MSTSKIIKAYITDLNGNRVTGAYVSDTVTALTYDGQTYTRNAQTGRSFAIAKDGDDFVAYLYNPDEAVSDGLVATFEGDLQWSDAPVLPTVTLANAYVYSASEPSTMTIWAGNSFMAKDTTGNNISYDTSLLYNAYASYADTSSPIWFNNGWTPIESSGLLAIMNNASSGSRTVHHVCYATCSDPTATVVTVYNSSNVAYNAFKFNASGTDYYYVLDGTQTDWTDDLAAAGYTEVQPVVTLPTVTKLDTLYNTLGTVNAGQVETLRTTSASGQTLDYNKSLTYAVWYYRPSGSAVYGDLSKVSIVSNSGYVAITATEYVQAYYIGVYTCSSLSVNIILVYDSSNVAHNAFKFAASGTDYYYVLDGVQADWTDDLAGIGYSLIPTAQTVS